MSTPASVWPARTSTPPGRAISGKTWPGETSASGPCVASIATAMVRARSAALIPVEMPSLASIETVKAVSLRLRLLLTIGWRPSVSARSLVSARQIRPRPWRAMKLIASGVAICAGNDEIALILPVVIVDQDEHAAVACLVDDRLGADQHFGIAALKELLEPDRACPPSDSTRPTPVCARNWDGGRQRGPERRG